jgi:hypothetical protein
LPAVVATASVYTSLLSAALSLVIMPVFVSLIRPHTNFTTVTAKAVRRGNLDRSKRSKVASADFVDKEALLERNSMYLSTVDRLVKKLGPVNTLIETLCERLLPNQVAHAGGGVGQCECMYNPDLCTIRDGYYAYFCDYGPGTPYEFEGCVC